MAYKNTHGTKCYLKKFRWNSIIPQISTPNNVEMFQKSKLLMLSKFILYAQYF